MKKIFNFELPTGQKVTVDYNSRAFSKDSICPHLEFHGEAISETGYRSHFFGNFTNPIEPPIEEVENLAKQLIEEWSGVKFNATVQRKLFI
jgi:hypothetical protein